jgi:SPP1 gp7 family putative phage head morphogenesis protein
MSNFFQRLGSALIAFSDVKSIPMETKGAGAPFPFDQIPVSTGSTEKLNQPMSESVWVQSAIKKISMPIADVPLRFRDPVTEQEIEGEPWLEFWQDPVEGMDYSDMIEAMVGWLKLDGEDFIILPEEFTVPFPESRQRWPKLRLARPDCMRAVKKGGQLVAWELRGAEGQRLVLPPEQVVHPKYWNPYDNVRGLSEYEAARVATEADYMAGKFALNLSRSNGNTGLIINLDGASLPDDTQQKQITASIRMWQEKSRRGEFSSVFIPAGLKLDDPKIKSTDANYVAQRLQNRHEIYIAFHVPPSMADIQASYSVGSASDWYRLIVDACIPTSGKLARGISTVASRMAGRRVQAYFDFDEHPVMQAVRRERIDSWTKLVDRGVPGETASDYLDLDLPEYPAGKVGLLPFSLAPYGETPTMEDDTNLSDTTEIEEETPVTEALQALRALRARNITPAAKTVTSECGCDLGDITIRAGDSADVKLWKSRMAVRRETIAAYTSKFTRLLMLARREVLAKLDRAEEIGLRATRSGGSAYAEHNAWLQRASAADFLFDVTKWGPQFQAAMRTVAIDALQKAGDQVFAELKRDDPWKMPSAESIQFLRDRENRLANVPEDVYGRVKDTIEDGLNKGSTLKQIATDVRGTFNDISERRAKTIATTETSAAFAHGRHVALKAAGVQYKRWLVSGNSNVRASHRAMNGTIVSVDELFVVTNLEQGSKQFGEVDAIKHPADSAGAAWNVINCNCIELAEASPSEDVVEPS